MNQIRGKYVPAKPPNEALEPDGEGSAARPGEPTRPGYHRHDMTTTAYDTADAAPRMRSALRVLPTEPLTVTFAAGQVIFSEGDEPDCLYVIRDGKVRIGRCTPDGRACTLTVMGPGDLFGEVSLLDVAPRTATATAMTAVHAVTMDRAQLLRRLAADPSSADDLLRILARRVRRTTDNLVDLMSADVAARTSKHLLRLAQRFGVQRDGGVLVDLDLNQEEFAQMVGASRETINKTLADFVAAGWIRVERHAVFIVDSEPLTRRMNGSRHSGTNSVS
jgi:CRP-like cAMP-binding protein